MSTMLRSARELVREVRDMPPEVLQVLIDLARAMKRGSAPQTSDTHVEQMLAGYREKADGFDFGRTPDTDYAEEVMAVYRSTFPRMPVGS
jgi:hypothetical protein